MVQVPKYERTERDRPILQQGVTSRASPNDFGAQIGQAGQNVARGLQQASDNMAMVRDLEDAALAMDADNAFADWSREAMYGANGYMTTKGRNAVEGRDAIEKTLDEKQKEFGADLKSPGAARRYTEAAAARVKSMKDSMVVHQAQQRAEWMKESSAARAKGFADDALVMSDNPAKVEKLIAAGQMELQEQGRLEGWDSDTLGQKEREYISGVHHNIALRKAIDDPLAAEAYLEEHREQLTGADQYALENSLATAVKTEKAKQAAAEIITRIEAGDGDIEAALGEIDDPEVRELARTSVAGILQQQAAAEKAKTEALRKQAADLVFTKGVSPLTFPPELQAALGQEGMKELVSTWTMLQNGPAVTDPVLKYELIAQSASDPVAFAKRDLLAERMAGRLSDADFETLANKQAEIGAGKDIALTTAFSQSTTALEGVGLSLTGLDGGKRQEMAGRIAEFQNSLAALIEEHKAGHDGQNPDQAEVQSMINRLLLPVVIGGGPVTDNIWNPFDQFFGGGRRDAFLFEAGTRPDGSSVEVALKYEDVPTQLRTGIRADLERSLGRKVSDQEVTDEYERFLLQ